MKGGGGVWGECCELLFYFVFVGVGIMWVSEFDGFCSVCGGIESMSVYMCDIGGLCC